MSDDFALIEQVIDESTRVVDVHGTIDAVRVTTSTLTAEQAEAFATDLEDAACSPA